MNRKSISVEELSKLVSPERLGSYRQTGQDPAAVVDLYEWNMAVSAALFETLGIVEVILRNAFHQQLEKRHPTPGNWYDAPWLKDKGRKDVLLAKARATNWGKNPELPGKVVAELNFGFWRFLVAKRYQATAWPTLQRTFPLHPEGGRPPRKEVDDRLQRLHILRNRIAHHEPLITRKLEHDHDDMLTLIGWVSAEARGWVAELSKVELVLRARPVRESGSP